MYCPICQIELKLSNRQGIEMDYCPQCRGIWLDRGELDKIIQRSLATSPWREDYSDRYRRQEDTGSYKRDFEEYDPNHWEYEDSEYYNKRKRRKSFLEDLFDFD